MINWRFRREATETATHVTGGGADQIQVAASFDQ